MAAKHRSEVIPWTRVFWELVLLDYETEFSSVGGGDGEFVACIKFSVLLIVLVIFLSSYDLFFFDFEIVTL